MLELDKSGPQDVATPGLKIVVSAVAPAVPTLLVLTTRIGAEQHATRLQCAVQLSQHASLFHVPSQELPRVLRQLHAALKPGGVLFSSNPHGRNEEGWSRGRYGVYHDLEAWRRYLLDAGFIELEYYYRPTGLPREQQPWLASVWRRPKKDQIALDIA